VGAAGPLSNIALALIHLLILRLVMLFSTNALRNGSLSEGLGLAILSVVVYILYMGVAMNVILAVFNLIPVPPFDGSRIFYAFLPPKWYFGVMKYERYIMLGCILLFFALNRLGLNPLITLEGWIINGMFTLTGMGSGTLELGLFSTLLNYLESLLAIG
jgi:Zn-dependent protease